MFLESSRIARLHTLDAFESIEHSLNAPEATSSKDNFVQLRRIIVDANDRVLIKIFASVFQLIYCQSILVIVLNILVTVSTSAFTLAVLWVVM